MYTNQTINWFFAIFVIIFIFIIRFFIKKIFNEPSHTIINEEEDKYENQLDQMQPKENKGEAFLTEHINDIVNKNPEKIKKLSEKDKEVVNNIKKKENKRNKKK